MIWVTLLLPRSELGGNDQPRDAQRLSRTPFHHWGGFDKTPYDGARGRFPFPIHGFDTRELLFPMKVFWKKFIAVRFILELRHDLWSSIGNWKNLVIPDPFVVHQVHLA